MKSTSFILLLFCLCNFGCASLFGPSKEDCVNMNWSEKGYDTAMNAQTEALGLETWAEKCEQKHGVKTDLTQFHSGYEKGLAAVCTESGGHEIGRTGRAFSRICPKEKEQEFYNGYFQGKLESIQEENQRLKSKINTLENKLQEKESEIDDLKRNSK